MAGVYTDDEEELLSRLKETRQNLISQMLENPGLKNNPRMLEVLAGYIKDQENTAVQSARLRIQKKEVDNAGQTKLLITELLRSANSKQEVIDTTFVDSNREHKTLDVELVDGETSQGVSQFDMKTLEEGENK